TDDRPARAAARLTRLRPATDERISSLDSSPSFSGPADERPKTAHELDIEYLATHAAVGHGRGQGPTWVLLVESQRDMAWNELRRLGGRRDMGWPELAAISPGAVARILVADVYLDGRELTDDL